jgi:sugar (pentulose or hexulose) kinase
MQMYDYATGKLSETLCAACGVEPTQFPGIMDAHRVQGEVTQEFPHNLSGLPAKG